MLMLSLYAKAKAMLATRDRGATAAEYAMLVAGIAAVIALIVFTFGDTINGLFSTANDAITKGE